MPKMTRKHRTSKTHTALADLHGSEASTVELDQPKIKQKRKVADNKENQELAGVILDPEEYSMAQDASNVAELTNHMREMTDSLKNVVTEIKELRKDVLHLSCQLSEHIATCSSEAVAPLADYALPAPPQVLGYTNPLKSSVAALPS